VTYNCNDYTGYPEQKTSLTNFLVGIALDFSGHTVVTLKEANR